MSDASLELQMRLKDDKVQTGLDQLARKEDDVAKMAAKIAAEAKKADQDLQRFAKRTTEVNATPLEKYNQQLAKLDQALKRGTISQETYNRAVNQAKVNLSQAGKAQEDAAGGHWVGKINALAQSWMGVHAVLAVVNQALGEAEARSNRAVDAVKGRLESTINLNALTKFGLSKAEADSLTSSAVNQGFLPDLEYFAAHKAGLGDVRPFGDVAGSFPKMFDSVTAREAVNIVGKTAQDTKLEPGQLAPLMATAAGGAREAGTTVHELAGAMAVLSSVMDPGKAATQLQNFSIKQSLNPRLQGQGLMQALNVLENDPELRKGFLKEDVQTNDLYQKLQARQHLLPAAIEVSRQAEYDTGTSRDWLRTTAAKNLQNQEISSPLKLIAAEEQRKLAEEDLLAGRGTARRAARENYLADMARRGRSGITTAFADRAMQAAEHVGLGERGVTAVGYMGDVAFSTRFFELFRVTLSRQDTAADKMSEAADAMTAAAKRMEDASKRPVPKQAMPLR